MDAQTKKESPFQSELDLLAEISRLLDESGLLEEDVKPAIDLLGEFLGPCRVALSLYEPETERIVIYGTHGLSEEETAEGRYQIGEGITGQVYETGEPKLIPVVGEERAFLGRTLTRRAEDLENFSFVCVPVKLETAVIGTLALLRHRAPRPSLENNLRLLTIIASLIGKAMDFRRLQREVAEKERLQNALREKFRPGNIIGQSKKMMEVFEQIRQVSPSDATVLLLGESGVGKELVAHAIHYNSSRAKGPFIKVNCAALPESVIESELFGHEKGAFTGALYTRKGRFEQAHRGTLFLDEIGDFTPAIQVSLLRFLQEREIERVGGNQTIRLDVRVIAATNRDLEKRMEEGQFRQDLFYRLNVFPIRIPSLRERKDDIPLLVDHFIRGDRNKGHDVRRISTAALNALMTYRWPGNVRELENFIERAVLVARNNVIRAGDLPPTLATAESSDTRSAGTLEVAMANLEREMISDALLTAHGNMAAAARELGITERIMGLRVTKYRINPKNYKTRGS